MENSSWDFVSCISYQFVCVNYNDLTGIMVNKGTHPKWPKKIGWWLLSQGERPQDSGEWNYNLPRFVSPESSGIDETGYWFEKLGVLGAKTSECHCKNGSFVRGLDASIAKWDDTSSSTRGNLWETNVFWEQKKLELERRVGKIPIPALDPSVPSSDQGFLNQWHQRVWNITSSTFWQRWSTTYADVMACSRKKTNNKTIEPSPWFPYRKKLASCIILLAILLECIPIACQHVVCHRLAFSDVVSLKRASHGPYATMVQMIFPLGFKSHLFDECTLFKIIS